MLSRVWMCPSELPKSMFWRLFRLVECNLNSEDQEWGSVWIWDRAISPWINLDMVPKIPCSLVCMVIIPIKWECLEVDSTLVVNLKTPITLTTWWVDLRCQVEAWIDNMTETMNSSWWEVKSPGQPCRQGIWAKCKTLRESCRLSKFSCMILIQVELRLKRLRHSKEVPPNGIII